MSYRLNELERLAKLLDDHKIGVEEYEVLKAEILEGTGTIGTPSGSVSPGVSQDHITNEVDSTDNSLPPIASLAVEHPSNASEGAASRSARSPAIYRVAFGAGIVSMFLGGTYGLLAWATVAVAISALASTTVKKGRWMAWTGLALGILFTLMNLYLNDHINLGLRETNSSPVPSSVAVSTPASLSGGMTSRELMENWNDLVTASELGFAWKLDEHHVDEETFTQLVGAKLIAAEEFSISVTGQLDPTTGDIQRATLSVHFSELVGGAGPSEYEKLVLAWWLFCYSIEGPDAPVDCADGVAEALGVPIEQLSDWIYKMNLAPGVGGYSAWAVRNGVEWGIYVAPYAVLVHARTD